uniref:Uncharacterized protein n=1 Tax=Avena sativa TaxID=4498 RepID=A0ACD5VLM0_AVESA
MAGQVSKEKLGGVLMQAMRAQKNLRPQRDRLLQLRRRLQQQRLSPGGGDDDEAAFLKELAADLFRAHFFGIETGARLLGCCLQQALKGGARPDFNTALAVIPDEQQYDVLVAHRLPARPTTQAEAFSRVEAAYNVVKLAQEHHLSRCIELLAGVPPPSHIRELPEESNMIGYSDDTVAAATAHIAKYGLPNLAKAAPATARRVTGKESQVASSKDPDQALTYLHRACSLLSLAVSHMDIAAAVLSSFVDPKEVASLSDFTDKCDGRSFAPSDSERWLTA